MYSAKQIHDLIERAAAGWDEMAAKHPGGPEDERADTLRRWAATFIRQPEEMPAITLGQWLAAGANRKAPLHMECGEVCVRLLGESLTWRGRGKDEHEAVRRALLAREKVHGAAL